MRSLIAAVAVLAPLLAIGAWLLKLSWALDEMYGPERLLARRQRFSNEVTAGFDAQQKGLHPEAERRYRSARRPTPVELLATVNALITALARAPIEGRLWTVERHRVRVYLPEMEHPDE